MGGRRGPAACRRTRALAVALMMLMALGAAGRADSAQLGGELGGTGRKLLGGLPSIRLSIGVGGTGGTSTDGGVVLPSPLQMLVGGPGMPAQESPQRWFKVDCSAKARPTIVLVPGISGSQLDGTQEGFGPCPRFTEARQVFADMTWLKNLRCLAHMISVVWDPVSKKLTNSTGTQLWAYQGGWPDGTDYFIWRTYYHSFMKELTEKRGYQLGVDLYAAPYDWRLGLDGLDQVGELDRMAARIEAAVKQNCGRKAVLISHSMGASVALKLLREPRFKQWRERNVRGLVQIGGALGGAAACVWQTRLSGVLDPFPGFTNLIPQPLLAQLPTFPLEEAIYNFTLGMPSTLLLMPTGSMALSRDHVLVRTPRRSYTVAQQAELLRDMGDDQSVMLLDKTLKDNDALLTAGPVPGVETFCVYGTAVPTAMTLEYGQDVLYRQPMRRPQNMIKGPGDGSVPLGTLRLCKMLAPESHIVEVADPRVDHSAVTREPAGLAALTGVLAKFEATA